jgi:hypothetical protein
MSVMKTVTFLFLVPQALTQTQRMPAPVRPVTMDTIALSVVLIPSLVARVHMRTKREVPLMVTSLDRLLTPPTHNVHPVPVVLNARAQVRVTPSLVM